jgi:hypothetical protein
LFNLNNHGVNFEVEIHLGVIKDDALEHVSLLIVRALITANPLIGVITWLTHETFLA